MSQAKSVKEVLIAARWLLVKHGWNQNQSHYENEDKHSFCAAGAIENVQGKNALKLQAQNALARVLSGNDFGAVGTIVSWNDHPARTKKEVLKAFDKTIEKCK